MSFGEKNDYLNIVKCWKCEEILFGVFISFWVFFCLKNGDGWRMDIVCYIIRY